MYSPSDDALSLFFDDGGDDFSTDFDRFFADNAIDSLISNAADQPDSEWGVWQDGDKRDSTSPGDVRASRCFVRGGSRVNCRSSKSADASMWGVKPAEPASPCRVPAGLGCCEMRAQHGQCSQQGVHLASNQHLLRPDGSLEQCEISAEWSSFIVPSSLGWGFGSGQSTGLQYCETEKAEGISSSPRSSADNHDHVAVSLQWGGHRSKQSSSGFFCPSSPAWSSLSTSLSNDVDPLLSFNVHSASQAGQFFQSPAQSPIFESAESSPLLLESSDLMLQSGIAITVMSTRSRVIELAWLENSCEIMPASNASSCHSELEDLVKEIRNECSAFEMPTSPGADVPQLPAINLDELDELDQTPSLKRMKLDVDNGEFQTSPSIVMVPPPSIVTVPLPSIVMAPSPSIIMVPPPCPDLRPASEKLQLAASMALKSDADIAEVELCLSRSAESVLPRYQICNDDAIVSSPASSMEEVEVVDLVNASPKAQHSYIELIYHNNSQHSNCSSENREDRLSSSPSSIHSSSEGRRHHRSQKRPLGMSLAGLSEEIVAERKRLQNRAAAARYRQKQRDSRLAERDDVEYFERRNAELRLQEQALSDAIAQMKAQIFAGVTAKRKAC